MTRLPPGAEAPALGKPPREVPPLVFVANLFGGGLSQVGWGLAGFAMIFMWFFIGFGDLTDSYSFSGDLETARGTVTDSRSTGFSVNDETVIAYQYRFVGPDGSERTGISFRTGRMLEPGTDVTVEFPADDPWQSRIEGMSRAPFGTEGPAGFILALVILGPMGAGVVLIAIGGSRGMRANRLLAAGHGAMARIKSQKPTGTRINNRTVHEFVFEFVAGDGQTYETTLRTHRTEDVTHEQGELLVYDPQQPEVASLLNIMPGGVAIDDRGQVRVRDLRRTLRSLVVPAIVILVHGTIAYFVWL
jgi:hypothetical protein